MKRFLIFVLTVNLLIFVWPVYGTSVHDNYVYFKGPHGFDFHMKDHSITDGQPFTGWYSGFNDHRGYICVHAGRHGSESVANWFKDRADVAVGDRVQWDSWPDKLNFAIRGDMILKGFNGGHTKCKDIVLGQGHTGAYNNWWMGAKSTTMVERDGIVWMECPPVDGYCGGVVSVYTVSGSSNTFDFYVQTCPPAKSDKVDYPLHR